MKSFFKLKLQTFSNTLLTEFYKRIITEIVIAKTMPDKILFIEHLIFLVLINIKSLFLIIPCLRDSAWYSARFYNHFIPLGFIPDIFTNKTYTLLNIKNYMIS